MTTGEEKAFQSSQCNDKEFYARESNKFASLNGV